MKLIDSTNVQQKLLQGINKVADVVGSTLGPKGTNVIIDKHYGDPIVTNDGVTIAKEIELEDKIENVGAKLIIQVAKAADDSVGDGTTTATVIAQALATEGLRHITAGANPIMLQKGMLQAFDVISDTLEKAAIPIKDYDAYYNVAYISSGGNVEISNMIANAIMKVGPGGVIQAEESSTSKSALHITEGVEFEPGFLSPYFVTDKEKNLVSFADSVILIMDHVLTDVRPILPVLQHASENQLRIVIIADDFEQEAITSLVMNKMKGVLNVCAIKAPSFGTNRKDVLKDIAVLTGGKVFSYDNGTQVAEMFKPGIDYTQALDMLGAAQHIRVSEKKTVIMNGAYDEEELKAHIALLEQQSEDEATDEHDKDWIKERLAVLTGSMAVIKIGATTQVQQKELMLRVEDAINSTKAAAEAGVLPGGGVGLLIAKAEVDQFLKNNPLSESATQADRDKHIGIRLVSDALEKPIEKIIKNSGASSDVIINAIKILHAKGEITKGYDAYADAIVDMIEQGVIDPAKVTISSVQNAISVVSTLISSGSVIVHVPEK